MTHAAVQIAAPSFSRVNLKPKSKTAADLIAEYKSATKVFCERINAQENAERAVKAVTPKIAGVVIGMTDAMTITINGETKEIPPSEIRIFSLDEAARRGVDDATLTIMIDTLGEQLAMAEAAVPSTLREALKVANHEWKVADRAAFALEREIAAFKPKNNHDAANIIELVTNPRSHSLSDEQRKKALSNVIKYLRGGSR